MLEGLAPMPSRIALVPLRDKDGNVIAHAIIDKADEEWASQWHWSLKPTGYAFRNRWGKRPRHEYMHRALGGAQPGDGMYVDHINRDRLDNRRANLRLLTPAESAQNKPALRGRFRGVTWDASKRKWSAQAQLAGRHHFIGRFATEEEAGAAVSAWRREHMPFSEEDVA